MSDFPFSPEKATQLAQRMTALGVREAVVLTARLVSARIIQRCLEEGRLD